MKRLAVKIFYVHEVTYVALLAFAFHRDRAGLVAAAADDDDRASMQDRKAPIGTNTTPRQRASESAISHHRNAGIRTTILGTQT